MKDLWNRLNKSLTFWTAVTLILTAIGSVIEGKATIQQAGVVVGVGLIAIFLRNAMQKIIELQKQNSEAKVDK